MRTRLAFTVFLILALLAVAATLTQAQAPLAEAGTAFTYQGRLEDAGSPANGVYDLQFKLFDSLAGPMRIGPTVPKGNIGVVDGTFTVGLDFGAAAFTGDARFLQVEVRPGASTGSYTVLLPRQELTATPYALHALSAPWSGLTGVPAGLDDGDQDTTYTAGTGLTLTGTEFAVDTGALQARVSGDCPVGSTVRVINDDGTVVCQQDAPLLRALPPSANSITTPASLGSVGRYSSVTIGVDGLPVMSYEDDTNAHLKVLHCGNADCTSDNIIATVDSAVSVGETSSIAIGADGMPLISYRDVTDLDLKVLHCGNATCTGGNTATTVDDVGDIGASSSIAIGVDGLPVISYLDWANQDLKVLHCGNAMCSSGNTITTVDDFGDVGLSSSIAIGADGLPVASYYDDTNDDLKVLHCGNVLCDGGNTINIVDSDAQVDRRTALAIGVDGLPVIGYYDLANGDLRVLHCGNVTCDGGNTATIVDGAADVGSSTAITIGADGLPVVSYRDVTNEDLKVLHCGNVLCDSGNSATTVDSAGIVGWYTAITIGTDGLPLVSYHDATNGDLKVLHCANAFCTPYFRRR